MGLSDDKVTKYWRSTIKASIWSKIWIGCVDFNFFTSFHTAGIWLSILHNNFVDTKIASFFTQLLIQSWAWYEIQCSTVHQLHFNGNSCSTAGSCPDTDIDPTAVLFIGRWSTFFWYCLFRPALLYQRHIYDACGVKANSGPSNNLYDGER